MTDNNANHGGNNEKTFTQAEVDAIIRERLERERKRYNADADAVTALNKQLESLKEELLQVKADKAEQDKAFKEKTIKSTIINALSKGNAVNTSSLYHVFNAIATIDDKGEVMATVDGKAVPMDEHIKGWLADESNSWAVKKPVIKGVEPNRGTANNIDGNFIQLRKTFNLE